jgi:hypothetical protein
MIRIAAVVAFAIALLAGWAATADDTVWTQEFDELAELHRSVPDAVELLQFGERAMAEGNYAAAAVRFAEAREFAPRTALLARRHCQALVALEQRQEALRACGTAFDRGGTEEDQRVLAALLASGPARGSDYVLWLVAQLALSLAALGAGMLLVRVWRTRRSSRQPSRVAL